MRHLLLALPLLLSTALASAAPCQADTPIGQWCDTPLAALHPTQPGIGQLQVENEAAELRELSADKLAAKIRKKAIPVVIGPGGTLYLVDRHHFASALLRLGVAAASVQVIGRLTQPDTFWHDMAARHWSWLRDQQGRPLAASALPATLAALPDDPYRSLAGLLQDKGYVAKQDEVYFVEFAWASWLGQQLHWANIDRGSLKQQLKQAQQLACSAAASQLPGYPGKACR
ncbi:ParB/Srx family N-terminal domain-containing protein [Vogesella sp. GCM10023246]|uniref:ParB/Srx family N-terminal domain-containing protein n=1 Tax=Vogesella oryzagri TaxID=3160864 RepID=A0ABV1M6I5_9NEIS